MTKEKRRHYRINTLNLLNYTCFDDDGNVTRHAMGRTLNVSESGILLETHEPIEIGSRVTLTIGLENDLVDIRGKVVFSKPGAASKHEAGIEFTETDGAATNVISEFIEAFREEKNI